jgi:hypothetical protein
MEQNNSNTASDWKDWEKKQSILTDLDDCPLHRKSPYGITNVSITQFSVARYYGGMNFNGSLYIYNPPTDELIREDVLKWQTKQWRLNQKQTKKQNEDLQEEMKWI